MPTDQQKDDAAKLTEWIKEQETAPTFNADTRNDREKAGFSNAQGDGVPETTATADFAYDSKDQPSYTSSGQEKKKEESKK